ncbi:MAG: precorrin-6A/cobalt-precorrin-6A reductase, partial [Desulfomonile tiedjei]|nr:precorrin-6A/cobalt-precorrin-6A reductase [Desulfomonile tiedjei]
MILLLGGTSETAPLAQELAEAGFRVLVSTATDVPLDRGQHLDIRFRTGALDEDAIVALITEQEIRAVVDASHPYAAAIRTNARRAAERADIPYFTWVRPACIEEHTKVLAAENHE